VRVLICLDVDGTIETSAGPVAVSLLERLRDAGADVVIVSPSSAKPQGFPVVLDGATRGDCLRAAKALFPADLCLYVSNNGDQAEAEGAGFSFVTEGEFR